MNRSYLQFYKIIVGIFCRPNPFQGTFINDLMEAELTTSAGNSFRCLDPFRFCFIAYFNLFQGQLSSPSQIDSTA